MSEKLRRYSKVTPVAGKPHSTIAYSPIPKSDEEMPPLPSKTLAIPLSAIQTTPNKTALHKDGEY